MAKRSKSSSRWLDEHFDDIYVQRAQREGYRSRAVYKLQELDEKYRLFQGGMSVIDLGAAPGGWTQYAMHRVGDKGTVIASDILAIDPIAGVEFIQGDFTEEAVFAQILASLAKVSLSTSQAQVGLVISDMAPNMSGIDSVDMPKAMYLVELAVDFAKQVLSKKGNFVCKMFQGQGSDQLLKDLRTIFSKVVVKKPKASRPRSREVYIVANGFEQ